MITSFSDVPCCCYTRNAISNDNNIFHVVNPQDIGDATDKLST